MRPAGRMLTNAALNHFLFLCELTANEHVILCAVLSQVKNEVMKTSLVA